jgi:segregation and condensation protein B
MSDPAVDQAPSDVMDDELKDGIDEEPGAAPPVDAVLVGHLVAILFAADEPLSTADLARLLEIRLSHLHRIAAQLAKAPPAGLLLQRDDDRLQLVTAPGSARYVRRLRGLEEQTRISRAALEVLAVVAYRQPATRAEIEAIRGVNGDRALATLLTRGLIAEVGRRDTVGRPVLFGTTLGFLEHLGLGSLDDLPAIPVDEAPVDTDGPEPASSTDRPPSI